MRAGSGLLSILLVGACGPASRPAPPVNPAAANESSPVTFLPGSTHYRTVTRLRVEQEFDGRLQTTDLRWVYFTTATIAGDADGRLRATIVLDSIEPDPGGLLSPTERERARGARFSGLLSPDGRLEEFAGADSLLPGRLRQLAGGFGQFLPRIPASGAAPGLVWFDTTETSTRSADGDVVIRLRNERRTMPWGQFAGARTIPIEVTSHYTLSGAGQQFGQPFTLEGTGTRTARQYLGADGHYAGGDASDSASVTVTLSQMGIKVPGRQRRTDTLTVLR